MVFRLSIVTSLLALFAFSFSTLMAQDRQSDGESVSINRGCYDQGAVCVR